MPTYRQLTDNLIRWAPGVVAGIFATVMLAGFLPGLGYLLGIEAAAVLAAACFLAGRWRLLTPWDALGFTRYRDYLFYGHGFERWGLMIGTVVAAIALHAVLGSFLPAQNGAVVAAILFCISVARATQRWPVDALEKDGGH